MKVKILKYYFSKWISLKLGKLRRTWWEHFEVFKHLKLRTFFKGFLKFKCSNKKKIYIYKIDGKT